MVTPQDCTYLVEAVAPLCAPIYGCLARAVELSDDYLAEYGMLAEDYAGGGAHIARMHLRRLLSEPETAAEMGPWQLSPPANNVQVKLTAHSTMSLRVLRAVPFGEVPPPGRNLARVAYYRNDAVNLFGVRGSDLVGTWWVDQDDGEVRVRIVRPRGRWRYGAESKVDVDFMLPRHPDDLSRLEFLPDDENLSFDFPDDDEREGDGDASGLGG